MARSGLLGSGPNWPLRVLDRGLTTAPYDCPTCWRDRPGPGHRRAALTTDRERFSRHGKAGEGRMTRDDTEKPTALQLFILLWQRELVYRAEQRKAA
jgi:hypothetical protein